MLLKTHVVLYLLFDMSCLVLSCLVLYVDHPEQVEAIRSIAKVQPTVVQNKFCPFSPGYRYDNHAAVRR